MILRCFIILYVQILSGFENWDIQDLTLRRYDKIKTCRWNFFKFFWVVYFRKICKNQVFEQGTTMQFLEIKNITKIEQNCFLSTDLHSKYISDCNWTRIHNHLVRIRIFVYELSACGFESSCSHLNFRFRACFEQGVQATIECGFTQECVRDMTRTYRE